jgi:hypothetical protein
MKREMLKSYESPLTVRTQVALESGICAASAISPTGKSAEIDDHVVNDDFSADFSETKWE